MSRSALLSFVLSMLVSSNAALGQGYPHKPIRIVTASIGAGSDVIARLIAQGITGPLGQPTIVDNRGGGVIPGEVVSKAAPDGYTLLVQSGTLWLAPLLQNTPYNAVKDFSPVTLAVSSPNVVVVHPSVQAKTVKELIALAKAKPGELNYGSAPAGSSTHLATELFKAMAGVDLVRVTYKGNGQALTDMIAGQLQVMFATGGSVAQHIKSGRLRALAVTSAEPSLLFAGLPTVKASGLPDYEAETLNCVWAPAKTPAPIIQRLNREIVGYLKRLETKEQLSSAGLEAVGGTPEQLVSKRDSEIVRMGKVIKSANIRGE